MIQALQPLKQIRRKWLLVKTLEIFVLAMGFGILVYFLTLNLWFSIGAFSIFLFGAFFLVKPRRYNLSRVCSHVDATFPQMEYSATLLLTPTDELSILGKIQQHKVVAELERQKGKVRFENSILMNSGIALVLVLLGFGLHYFGVLHKDSAVGGNSKGNELIQFQAVDSATVQNSPPIIMNQKVTITYPPYTKKKRTTTSKMDLKVLEGAKISWDVQFDKTVDSTMLQFGDDTYLMKLNGETYSKSLTADYSKIYNLKFVDRLGNPYLSDLYALEVDRKSVV